MQAGVNIFLRVYAMASLINLVADMLDKAMSSLDFVHDDERDRSHVILVESEDRELGKDFVF